jgi:hypothetical protein
MTYRTIIFFLLPLFPAAQTIPSSRTVDWGHAGLEQSFVQPSASINVMSFGAAGDSTQDDAPAITAAINSLNGHAGIIIFPAGTYLLHSSLSLPDSVILKGSSPDSVKLFFDLGGAQVNCIDLGKFQTAGFVPVISGYTKGSDTLVLGNTTGINAGDMIELREQNGAWDVQPASWAAYSVGQIVRVNAITGNTLHLAQPLRIDYNASLNPEVRRVNMLVNAGLECLRIERLDAAASGYNVSLSYAYNCRIKGIESSRSAGAHIAMEASSHISVAGSYFHHAFLYDGTSTRGYGVMLAVHSSDCLIENNNFKHLRHSMMAKQGANGNVFAYNYSIDPYRSESPNNGGGDISLHGHYAFANLFEGNIVQNIHIDQTWGPSGPYNTFFRNRAELYGLIMSTGSGDSMKFVGNEITSPSGFYLINGNNQFEYANNVHGTIQPTGTTSLPDASYYRSSPPAYWIGSAAWPSIGAPNTLGSGSNTAQQMYLAGAPTVCSAPSSVQVNELAQNEAAIYPNPAHDRFTIRLDAINEDWNIAVYDPKGKLILHEKQHNSNAADIYLPAALSPGVFIISVISNAGATHYKLIRY